MFNILLPFIFITALSHIAFDGLKKDALCYVFKPLTTVLIIALAWSQTSTLTAVHYWVFVGLVLSLLGDIFLMLKKDYFLQGLIAFFFAHVAYVVAFTHTCEFALSTMLLVALLVYAGLLIAILNKQLGRLRIPVYAYAAALTLMVLTSYNFYQVSDYQLGVFTFVGALFFMVSDSILAYRRFIKSYIWSQPAILLTYYLAQTLIALSLTN
ncbi:lysoplasmalogenase [Pseudoalteromonas sp. SSDWG2]|uniref:lysoplasmalogenase n=1 Tax=Pseudoalteromonas sp. SSDWG2 TaxID=3139391 RepID=UPI003BABF8F8